MTSVAGERAVTPGASGSDAVRFCSYCGGIATDEPATSRTRVCPSCGLGVLLATRGDALSRSGEAFLVLTAELRIVAASSAVAPLIGRPERLVGARMLELLTSPLGDAELTRRLLAAAAGTAATVAEIALETRGHEGRVRRLEARIATCGEPRAALVVMHNAR